MCTHLSKDRLQIKFPVTGYGNQQSNSVKTFTLVCRVLTEQASFPVSLLGDICIPTEKLKNQLPRKNAKCIKINKKN